jgi:hypothetical protein
MEKYHFQRRAALALAPSKDLAFGFGFLPVLSEMGEIREFRCFSVVQI